MVSTHRAYAGRNAMRTSSQIVDRLHSLVRERNREIAIDATIKVLLGVLFSLLVFGFVFWGTWLVGFFVGSSWNIRPWQLGLLVASLFFVVALWSAWRHVNPLAGLKPLSDEQLLLTIVSQATADVVYFSPRHALAGAALLLIGGPANIVEAVGIWAYRIRADGPLVDEAARLLTLCEGGCPPERVREPAAALILRRLALIKVVPSGDDVVLTLTEKGLTALTGGRARRRKARRVSRNSPSDAEE
jgi:hypothetical protein